MECEVGQKSLCSTNLHTHNPHRPEECETADLEKDVERKTPDTPKHLAADQEEKVEKPLDRAERQIAS